MLETICEVSERKGFYEARANTMADVLAEALAESQGDLRGMREMALWVLKFKFGPLPESIEARLNAIEEDKAKINGLAASVLQA